MNGQDWTIIDRLRKSNLSVVRMLPLLRNGSSCRSTEPCAVIVLHAKLDVQIPVSRLVQLFFSAVSNRSFNAVSTCCIAPKTEDAPVCGTVDLAVRRIFPSGADWWSSLVLFLRKPTSASTQANSCLSFSFDVRDRRSDSSIQDAVCQHSISRSRIADQISTSDLTST